MTNREWLENLTDEELAAELDDWLCLHCIHNRRKYCADCSLQNNCDKTICRDGTVKWLQAEYED